MFRLFRLFSMKEPFKVAIDLLQVIFILRWIDDLLDVDLHFLLTKRKCIDLNQEIQSGVR